jgi:glutaredoxin
MEKFVMYTIQKWPSCVEAKSFFAENNIEYVEKDCANKEYLYELKEVYKQKYVPTFIIDGEIIVDFSPDMEVFKNMIKK